MSLCIREPDNVFGTEVGGTCQSKFEVSKGGAGGRRGDPARGSILKTLAGTQCIVRWKSVFIPIILWLYLSAKIHKNTCRNTDTTYFQTGPVYHSKVRCHFGI